MYSDFDFLDMMHMLLFYYGAQYLTNGSLSIEPTFFDWVHTILTNRAFLGGPLDLCNDRQ